MSNHTEEEDLSQIFGEPGTTQFGDLPKRAASPSAPQQTERKAEAVIPSSLPSPVPHVDDFPDELLDIPEDGGVEDAFSVGIYVLPGTTRVMEQIRKTRHLTNAQMVMDAIDYAANKGTLGKLIARRQAGPGRPKDSLFPTRRTQHRPTGGQKRKLWSFQATAAELAVMDELVERFKANSRSELVSVALEARYKPRA